MSINFDSQQSHNDYNDGANISISKKMHIRTIDANAGVLSKDQIEKSDSGYKEPYVPPAGSPELGLPDPYADTSKPKSAPSPQNAFLQKVQSQIANLTPGQLATLGNGVTKGQAQAQLLFAFNHPDVPVDPDVQNLLNQMTSNALAGTQKQFNLPSSWQPNPPDTESADKEIGAQANKNFENLAYSELPMDKANKLIFQYYHPEFADPSDSALLNKFIGQSNGEIADQEGLPDGWSMKPDSFAYDAKLAVFNDDAFTNHLNSDPETQDLSDNEKAQLETLHHFPDADVPDKDKLKKFLAQTEQNAAKDTANKFNLPAGLKLGTGSQDYAATILGEFNTKFAQNVRNVKPPLSQAQMMKLLATGGINSKNLSPALAALFSQLQGKTADDIADLFGLPKNWLQASKATDEAEGLPEDGEEAEKAEGADKTAGMAFPEVMRRLLGNKRAGGSKEVSGVAGARSGTNYQAALNAVQLYQDGSRIFGHWANKLASNAGGPLNNNWIVCGDFTFAVTKALDKVRASVYQVQAAEAQMSVKTSQMTTDNQATQNLISAQQLQNEQAQQKANNQKDVFAALENLPGIGGVLAKVFVTWVKTIFWVLDTILGGALTAICNACGIQSLAENPLESLGLITPAQAAKMDQVLQIIAQVVEILVEIVMAQPELIAASIASIAEDVAEVATDVVLQTVVKAVVEDAVKEGAEIGAEEGMEATAKTALKDAIKEVSNDIVEKAGKALSESGRKALRESVEKALNENASKIVKTAVKKADKIIKDAGQQVFKGGEWEEDVGGQIEEFANKAADKGLKEANGKVSKLADKIAEESEASAGSKIKNYITKAAKMTGRDIQGKFVKAGEEGEDGVIKSTAKAARAARMGKLRFVGISTAARRALDVGGVVKDLVQGSMSTAADVLNGIKDQELAKLAMQSGELDAAMAELDADLQIMKKAQEAILDTLSNLAGWINDINQQENEFFKKAQIHFISA